MKKYLVLYQSTASASQQMAQATPEQVKAGMDAWMAWAARVGTAIVDFGTPVGNGVTVSGDNTNKTIGAGVGGFSILQAESPAALNELLKGHPHFMAPGATIDVHEFLPLPGMS